MAHRETSFNVVRSRIAPPSEIGALGATLIKVYKGTSILMLAIVIATALIMVFPEIVLWLPRTMK